VVRKIAIAIAFALVGVNPVAVNVNGEPGAETAVLTNAVSKAQ
jgi:hypothetical protein